MYACADRCGCTHAYLSFEPLYLSVLVLQLSTKLIGCDLLRLHDLNQVDVLLHQDLALDDDVRVTKKRGAGWENGTGGTARHASEVISSKAKLYLKKKQKSGQITHNLSVYVYAQMCSRIGMNKRPLDARRVLS